MRKHLICLALLAAMPMAALAQEAEDDGSGFSWNAAVTSEYMFRGVSQTDDHPAIQAGADYTFGSGFYVGAWASNVDFGEGTDAEIDTFVGWGGDLGDNASLDVQLVRYNYVGEPDDVDYAYNELIGNVTFNDQYTITVGYTNDYLNSSTDSWYGALGGSWEAGAGINVTANVGYTTIKGPADGYLDYSVGVNRDFGPVNVSLNYVDTDNSAEDFFGEDNTENRFVLTVSIEG